MKYLRIVALLLLLAGRTINAQDPYFEYVWTEGDGPITLSTTDLRHFGETVGRFEIDWTPGVIPTTGVSQRLLDIPNHLGVWAWNDGIHGAWFNDAGQRRLFRTRWGLPAVGVEIKIVVTWNLEGYAVIVDGVVRIHDWQTPPTTVFPDPDAVSGVYGGQVDGANLPSGTFKLRTYDQRLAYDACSVDVVGTINANVPLNNTGSWSEGIDPACAAPTPPPTPTQNTITFTAEATTGVGTVTPVLTWDTMPLADDCVASGDWSGNKGGAGTETLAPISIGATYNIRCEWLDDFVTLTWLAPTENTDGTPYTDPKGFKIFYGMNQGGPYDNVIDLQDAAVTRHVISPLISGSWFFVATAYNLNNVESERSNEAMKILGLSSKTESVGITVNPTPNPPVALLAE